MIGGSCTSHQHDLRWVFKENKHKKRPNSKIGVKSLTFKDLIGGDGGS